MKKTIFLFADWFEPGFKAGGPIRSCVHFVHQMKDQYTIYVFTSDRDLNDKEPYNSIETDTWIEFDKGVNVFYSSPNQLSWSNIHKQIRNINPDFVYLNSMYSRYFTVYPLLMKRLNLIKGKIILSPRGMLKESALQFKAGKKKLFLNVFRRLRMHRFIHFHATDKTEERDVKKYFGDNVQVSLASNFPGMIREYGGSIVKMPNELSIIFIGRLHPVKNLDYLLRALEPVVGNVSLTVVGNAEDENYVAQCKSIVNGLSANIRVHFAGEIPNEHLSKIIAQHHIFALPTQGENFGHAIFEALAGGKPVLISDQTPWRNLSERQAGWDISLQQPQVFTEVLQQVVSFSQAEYDTWSIKSWQFVKEYIEKDDLRKMYNNLFS